MGSKAKMKTQLKLAGISIKANSLVEMLISSISSIGIKPISSIKALGCYAVLQRLTGV